MDLVNLFCKARNERNNVESSVNLFITRSAFAWGAGHRFHLVFHSI